MAPDLEMEPRHIRGRQGLWLYPDVERAGALGPAAHGEHIPGTAFGIRYIWDLRKSAGPGGNLLPEDTLAADPVLISRAHETGPRQRLLQPGMHSGFLFRSLVDLDRKSTRLNSSHLG